MQFTCEVSTTLRTTLEERGPEVRDAVWKELGVRAAQYADSSGRVCFVNRAWCAGARA